MIKIKIEQVTLMDYGAKEIFVTHEEPATDSTGAPIYSEEYSSRKVTIKKDYAVHDVVKQREVTTLLLQQEIPVDAEFDLKAVISAINKLVVA